MNGFALPMGSTFTAVIVNSLLSSDAAQPVIAQVNEAVFWKNSVFIPEGTRAIGNASFDDVARRLPTRGFHVPVECKNYAGDPENPEFAQPDETRLGLGSFHSPVRFHKVEVIEVTPGSK